MLLCKVMETNEENNDYTPGHDLEQSEEKSHKSQT